MSEQPDVEFRVWDEARQEWVRGIEPWGGTIEYTGNEGWARIFTGDAWEQFWCGLGMEIRPLVEA